jgi:hypothetical protein
MELTVDCWRSVDSTLVFRVRLHLRPRCAFVHLPRERSRMLEAHRATNAISISAVERFSFHGRVGREARNHRLKECRSFESRKGVTTATEIAPHVSRCRSASRSKRIQVVRPRSLRRYEKKEHRLSSFGLGRFDDPQKLGAVNQDGEIAIFLGSIAHGGVVEETRLGRAR